MDVRTLLTIGVGSLFLTACGGSSSPDAPEQPVTATAADPAAASKLTIRGAVTDDPIDSATVRYRVGEREFEAARISDNDGAYEIEIEYDSLDDVVIGEAVRGATNIHFVGDVTTVRELLAGAQDGVVDAGRITNLTTAKYVLASNATDDGQFDSLDEFATATDGVDPYELLTVSAAIKTVVESIDGTVLPVDVADTLELAERIADGSSSFVQDLATTSPGTLPFAINKMLNDGFATLDFEASDVPAVYMSNTASLAYVFFADGSGLSTTFADAPADRVRQWQVNTDGDLALTYAADPGQAQVLKLLSSTSDRRQISVEADADGGDEAASDDVANFVVYRFAGEFDVTTVPGNYATADGSGFELVAGGSGWRFDVNGTVSSDLTWRVDGNGRLILDFGSGETRSLTQLGGATETVRTLSLDVRTGGAIEGVAVQEFTKR